MATVHLRDEGRPPLEFSQKKKLRNPSDGFFAPTEDTGGSLSLQEIRSPQSRFSILSVDGEAVKKFDDRTPDFSAPEPEPTITPPDLKEMARIEKHAPTTERGSSLDIHATRLADEGKLTPEHLADTDKPRRLSQKKDLADSPSRVFSPDGDTNGGLTVSALPQSAKSAAGTLGETPRSRISILSVDGEAVKKFDDPTPSFSAPEPEPTITPPDLEEMARIEKQAPTTERGSSLDLHATRLADEGKLTPEHLAEWAAAQEELQRVDSMENAGLTILECVTNVIGGGL